MEYQQQPENEQAEIRQQMPQPQGFPGPGGGLFPGLGGINARLDRLENRLDRQQRQLDRLDRRLSRIEQVLGLRF